MSPKPPVVLEILRTSSLSSLLSSSSRSTRREGLFAFFERRRRVHQREKTFRIGNKNNNKQLEMRMMISGGESSLKRRRKRSRYEISASVIINLKYYRLWKRNKMKKNKNPTKKILSLSQSYQMHLLGQPSSLACSMAQQTAAVALSKK